MDPTNRIYQRYGIPYQHIHLAYDMFRSDKASLLAITGNSDQALPLFLSIHKDYPDDNIVISNIAYIYKTMGDKENALKYYRLLSKCDDEEMEELAREAISELTE